AADVRLALPRFSEDVDVASAIGVSSLNLPTRGLGLSIGAHWYPLRGRVVTLGLGGEILVSRGRDTLEAVEEGGPPGPTVVTRFSSVSPQLSLNFGSSEGWSYLTGGIGWAGFTTEREDMPVAEGERVRAFNYGGGARWFAKKHLAFAVDLRFYAMGAQAAAPGRPGYGAQTRMVISAGMAFK
ncbi:MAG TPA: hypothetical protein VLD67_04760, partial [Vicinamibacterales bacterium]|nr:hypothetical protein [Vicinamibacterales bacterium]